MELEDTTIKDALHHEQAHIRAQARVLLEELKEYEQHLEWVKNNPTK